MKNSLVSAGLKLSILTLISRLLGLVREMTKAHFLGTSVLADAFGIAFMIPNLLRRLFAENSISIAFIPTFKSYIENKSIDKNTIHQFICATFTLVSFLSALAVSIGIIITPYILPFFVENSTSDIIPEMTVLTRIMFPYLFVISIAAFFQGILNGIKIFAPSGFTPILFNISVIGATYALSPYTENPARAMAYGVIIGGTLQSLFQLPFVIKSGFFPFFCSLKKAFKNPGTKKVLSLVAPTVAGMAVYQLNDVVSTILAGRQGEGIVSSLQYSIRLQELILGIFVVSISTVILPDLSTYAKNKDKTAFNEILNKATHIIALVTIPITFFALLFGENIIRLVYESNQFTDTSVKLTLQAFVFHIGGLYFIGLNRIIAPSFYAQQNTKLPTLAGIIGFGVNIVLAIILVNFMSGGGIALALSLASAINTVMLFIFLRKNDLVGIKNLLASNLLYALKLIVLSLLSLFIVYTIKSEVFRWFLSYHRFISQGVPLLICAIAFALCGIVLLIFVKDPLVLSVLKKRKLH